MYNIIKTVIEAGNFELTDIIRKIDTVWFEGKISDEEKAELVEMAQGKANPQHSIDLVAKVADLEKRVKALETQTPTEPEDEEEYPPFEEGKWYYNGDKISFEGNNYVCIAPDGVVCVWSPSAYPTYWEKK
jgi:hypothetical protein